MILGKPAGRLDLDEAIEHISGGGRPLSARAAAKVAKVLALVAPEACMNRLENPTFVISAGQTGTTWLERYLHQHRDLAVYVSEANELWHPNHYPAAVKMPNVQEISNPRYFSRESYQCRNDKSFEHVQAVFGAYQALLDKPVFVNKATLICFLLPEIARAFPSARFIHLVRDGRAVALSKAKKHLAKRRHQSTWLGSNRFRFLRRRYNSTDFSPDLDGALLAEELAETSAYWVDAVKEVRDQVGRLELASRGAFLELRYEDICGSPDQSLEELFEFIGVDPRRVIEAPDVERPVSRNRKVLSELPVEDYQKLTDRMRPGLDLFGYS